MLLNSVRSFYGNVCTGSESKRSFMFIVYCIYWQQLAVVVFALRCYCNVACVVEGGDNVSSVGCVVEAEILATCDEL